MSGETTKNFGGEESFETRVLSELATLNKRLTAGLATLDARMAALEGRTASLELKVTALDEKVDARLRDTRPIWESVLERLKRIDAKFDLHSHAMLELRAKVKLVEERVLPDA
jgi:hypothetical protein